MIKIIKSYLIDKTRPEKYRRSYKFPEIIKDDNPNIVSVKYHHAWKGAIIFFSLLSVPFFSEKGVIDDSEKHCGDIYISLSDFKILLTGDTWYGGHGFKPFVYVNNSYEISEFEIKKYEKNKEIMKNLTIQNSSILDIIENQLLFPKNKESKNKEKIIKSLIELKDYLNKNKEYKLQKIFIHYFRPEKFSFRCIGLSVILEELFYKNKLTSYKNRPFILQI